MLFVLCCGRGCRGTLRHAGFSRPLGGHGHGDLSGTIALRGGIRGALGRLHSLMCCLQRGAHLGQPAGQLTGALVEGVAAGGQGLGHGVHRVRCGEHGAVIGQRRLGGLCHCPGARASGHDVLEGAATLGRIVVSNTYRLAGRIAGHSCGLRGCGGDLRVDGFAIGGGSKAHELGAGSVECGHGLCPGGGAAAILGAGGFHPRLGTFGRSCAGPGAGVHAALGGGGGALSQLGALQHSASLLGALNGPLVQGTTGPWTTHPGKHAEARPKRQALRRHQYPGVEPLGKPLEGVDQPRAHKQAIQPRTCTIRACGDERRQRAGAGNWR